MFICEYAKEAQDDPGIFFFESVTPSLCEQIHQLSHNGLIRVLAVAAARKTLSARDA